MSDVMPFLMVPMIIFMVVVAPVWLVLHYKSQSKMNRGLTEDESETLVKLTQQAQRMSDRVTTLEKILDAEVPDWREQ